MPLRKILKDARLLKGLSQGQVARKLGYTTCQFVSNWERGRSSPPNKVIKKIIQIYDLDREEIIELIVSAQIKKLRKELS